MRLIQLSRIHHGKFIFWDMRALMKHTDFRQKQWCHLSQDMPKTQTYDLDNNISSTCTDSTMVLSVISFAIEAYEALRARNEPTVIGAQAAYYGGMTPSLTGCRTLIATPMTTIMPRSLTV
jgi:hypothetical protein